MKQLSLIVLALLAGDLLTPSVADAGVKGGRYTGTVLNSFGNSVTVDDRFYNDGTITQLESGINFFTGSYSTDPGFGITTWQAVISDGSPDGQSLMYGTCFFGLVTTHVTLNTDINISAFGFLMRSGSATD
jgi:hypothetical protein